MLLQFMLTLDAHLKLLLDSTFTRSSADKGWGGKGWVSMEGRVAGAQGA